MSDEQVLYHGCPSLILKAGPLSLAGAIGIGSIVGAVMLSPWLLILMAPARDSGPALRMREGDP